MQNKNKSLINLSEHNLQNQIMQYLVLNKFLVIRFNSGITVFESTNIYGKKKNNYIKFYSIENAESKYKNSGLSDLIAFKDDITLFLEIKKNNNKQTTSQYYFENLTKKFNLNYFVVTSIDDVINILNNLKRCYSE